MKILIRLPNWLGDVVMSTAFVHAVGQLYPDAQVDVVIKEELAGIARLIPGITKMYQFSKQKNPGLSGVYHFGKALRKKQYDIYFNLPSSLSSAVMAWTSKAKQRVAFNKEGGFFLMTRSYKKPANLHRTDEYLYLLESFTGKTIPQKQVKLNTGQYLIFTNDTLVVNFNSEASSRRMPVQKGRQLLGALTAAFPNTMLAVVGSPKESAFVDELTRGLTNESRVQNLAGKTDLIGLARLMRGSKAVLSTDSGPAHLANSLGVPTVALFGAGNENNTAPYNKKDLVVLRSGQLSCEPCVRNTCKLYGLPKCMEMLDEKRIINALSLYLNHA